MKDWVEIVLRITAGPQDVGQASGFGRPASVAHLRENLATGQLMLAPDTLAELNGIAVEAATME